MAIESLYFMLKNMTVTPLCVIIFNAQIIVIIIIIIFIIIIFYFLCFKKLLSVYNWSPK